MFHVAADDISFAATFFAKVTSRSFCRGSSPNRNRLRRIAIWFWGTDLKAKTSMPMRCPASGQSLFYSGSGGMASGSLRRGGCGFGKARGSRADASAMAVTRKNCAGFGPKPAPSFFCTLSVRRRTAATAAMDATTAAMGAVAAAVPPSSGDAVRRGHSSGGTSISISANG